MAVIHVMPRDDARPHEEVTTCPCGTGIETQANGDIIVIHSSYDGREGLELAQNILSTNS